MNTRDIEYFIKLTELKNFSKVAQEFKVSQPSVTFALQRLEKELDTKLIIRHRARGQLVITDSGHQLLQHAKQMLRHYQLIKMEINNIKQKKLSLGLPPIIENNYFPAVARILKEKNLLSKINTMEYGSMRTLEALKNGAVDLALLGSIDSLSDEEIITEEFDRQTFSIFVSREHKLASKKNIYFAELRKEDFVLFKNGFVHNQAINVLAQRNHFRPHVIFRSNGTHSLMNLIADGVGVGFLTSVIKPMRTDIVKLNLLDKDMPQFVTSIAYRQAYFFNALQKEILDNIRTALFEKGIG